MTEPHGVPEDAHRRVLVRGVLLTADDVDMAQLLTDLAGAAPIVSRDLLRREWTITASDLNARMPLTPTRQGWVESPKWPGAKAAWHHTS